MNCLKKRDVKRLLKLIGANINLDGGYEIHNWKQPCPSELFSTEIRVEFDSANTHYMYQIFAVGNIDDDGSIVWYDKLTIIDITAD